MDSQAAKEYAHLTKNPQFAAYLLKRKAPTLASDSSRRQVIGADERLRSMTETEPSKPSHTTAYNTLPSSSPVPRCSIDNDRLSSRIPRPDHVYSLSFQDQSSTGIVSLTDRSLLPSQRNSTPPSIPQAHLGVNPSPTSIIFDSGTAFADRAPAPLSYLLSHRLSTSQGHFDGCTCRHTLYCGKDAEGRAVEHGKSLKRRLHSDVSTVITPTNPRALMEEALGLYERQRQGEELTPCETTFLRFMRPTSRPGEREDQRAARLSSAPEETVTWRDDAGVWTENFPLAIYHVLSHYQAASGSGEADSGYGSASPDGSVMPPGVSM